MIDEPVQPTEGERDAPAGAPEPSVMEEFPPDPAPPTGQPPRGSRSRGCTRVLLVALSVISIAAALGYYALPLLHQVIPVTGGEPPVVDAPDANRPTGPQPPAADRPATPIPGAASPTVEVAPAATKQPYGSQAHDRLDACGSSFEDFFTLERMAAEQPEIINSAPWRVEAAKAVQAFRADCSPLGGLPPAPRMYSSLERLLKQASDEVTPIADAFSNGLDGKGDRQFTDSMQHMLRFVDYFHQAEELLTRLDDLQQA